MKRKKIKLDEERKIITYMIVSDTFLKSINQLVRPSHFKSAYARTVSTWVGEYWKEYEKAPGRDIKDVYRAKKKSIRDEEEQDSVSDFLTQLSRDFEDSQPPNIQYQINQAIDYLKLRSLETLKESIEEAITTADPLAGEQVIANYRRVENIKGEGISLLKDAGRVTSAFMAEDELMFKFRGALGDVCGPFLRGDFAAFLGAPNKGKSWWLWYSAQVSIYRGFRVVFFTLEMTEFQVVRRAWQSLVGAPKYPKEIEIPYFEEMEKEEDDDPGWRVGIRKEKRRAVDASKIEEKQKALRRQLRSGDVRIVTLPAYSATVADIDAHLDNMAYFDNYVPDVIVIDYADIIAPSIGASREYRHQLDDVWKRLRGMAQMRNALVVSASQTNRAGVGRDAGGEEIAEDIRKLATVSKFIVMNQSPEDYKRGIMRISQIKERDERRSWREAVVLQSLDIGRPHLDSRFKDEVNYEESEEKTDTRTRKKGKG